MLTKLMLVATGAGIGLVPASFGVVPLADVVFLPLMENGEQMAYEMAFAVPLRHDNPLIDRFLETACDFTSPDAALSSVG